MILKDYPMDLLYTHRKRSDNKIELIDPKELNDDKKISIVSDSFFKTMLFNEDRIKYSSKLFSYFVDASYEELCENLTLVKDELDKNTYYDKGQRVDYVGKVGDTFLNLEVNNCSDEDVMKRNILYAFRLMNKNNKSGTTNKEATKYQSIQLNINNFSFEGVDNIVDVYTLRNKDNVVLSDSPIIIQIYLPNLITKYYNCGIESLNKFEKLLLVFIESDIKTCEELGIGDDLMGEFIEDAKEASHDEEILCAYDKEWETKEWGREEGLKEGYDSGFSDGIKQRNTEMVENMLKANMEISLISKITNLSEKEILEIKKSII